MKKLKHVRDMTFELFYLLNNRKTKKNLDSTSQKLKTNDHDSIHMCIQKSKEIYLELPYPRLRQVGG